MTKPLQIKEPYVMKMWMPTDGDPNGKQVLVDAVEAKHLRSLIEWVIGTPLDDDVTWKPTMDDPYGHRQMLDVSRTKTKITAPNYGSYETVKRQYQRLTSIMKG